MFITAFAMGSLIRNELSFQNILLALPWCLSMAILVAEFACAEEDYNLKAMLLSTTLLLSGLTTLAQVTIGIR